MLKDMLNQPLADGPGLAPTTSRQSQCQQPVTGVGRYLFRPGHIPPFTPKHLVKDFGRLGRKELMPLIPGKEGQPFRNRQTHRLIIWAYYHEREPWFILPRLRIDRCASRDTKGSDYEATPRRNGGHAVCGHRHGSVCIRCSWKRQHVRSVRPAAGGGDTVRRRVQVGGTG